jgi:hypothetical protein
VLLVVVRLAMMRTRTKMRTTTEIDSSLRRKGHRGWSLCLDLDSDSAEAATTTGTVDVVAGFGDTVDLDADVCDAVVSLRIESAAAVVMVMVGGVDNPTEVAGCIGTQKMIVTFAVDFVVVVVGGGVDDDETVMILLAVEATTVVVAEVAVD